MRFTHIVAGQTRPAIEQEQHIVAASKGIGDYLVSIDGDLDAVVGLDLSPHHGVRTPSEVAVSRPQQSIRKLEGYRSYSPRPSRGEEIGLAASGLGLEGCIVGKTS